MIARKPPDECKRLQLIQLLDDGKIAYRRLGTHRRIPLGDVLAFKADNYAKRKMALDDLVATIRRLISNDERSNRIP